MELHPEMPTGPMNRVADNALGRKLLGWEPRVEFMDGLRRTIDWYFSTKDPEVFSFSLYAPWTQSDPMPSVSPSMDSFYQ